MPTNKSSRSFLEPKWPEPVYEKTCNYWNLPSLNFSSRYTFAWAAYKYANTTKINKYFIVVSIFINSLPGTRQTINELFSQMPKNNGEVRILAHYSLISQTNLNFSISHFYTLLITNIERRKSMISSVFDRWNVVIGRKPELSIVRGCSCLVSTLRSTKYT